jgi:tetratricopeptide (TPR) repeat protein
LFQQGVSDFTLALAYWHQPGAGQSKTDSTAREWLVARLLIRRGLFLSKLAELEEAESSLQAGITRLPLQETDDQLYEKAIGLQGLARVALQRQAWSQAQQLYQASLEILQTIAAPLETAETWSGLAHVACELAAYDEAMHFDQKSLALYQTLNNPLGIATSLNNLSHIAEMAGNYEQARLWLQTSLAVANQASAYWLVAVTLSNLAHIASLQGAHDQAKAYLAESLKLREYRRLPGIKATKEAMVVMAQQNGRVEQPLLLPC